MRKWLDFDAICIIAVKNSTPVNLMKKLLLASVMLLVVPALSAKPNVLFIAIDDLNDWIGALGGHPQAKTPNLDRLAEEATLFTHA